MTGTYEQLPDGLPVPADDGAAAHLVGLAMPAIRLPATTGGEIDLAEIARDRSVLFLYPRTGQPGQALPDGWDDIPGARGCTPETIGFRDLDAQFAAAGVSIYGLSSQDPDYQGELADRLGLGFAILSDPLMQLASALTLPTFSDTGEALYSRLTLLLSGGRIEHVWYPVFPPHTHAAAVLEWVLEWTQS
jgi:peroxiredoxin